MMVSLLLFILLSIILLFSILSSYDGVYYNDGYAETDWIQR